MRHVLLALGVALVACGSDGDGGGEPAADAAPPDASDAVCTRCGDLLGMMGGGMPGTPGEIDDWCPGSQALFDAIPTCVCSTCATACATLCDTDAGPPPGTPPEGCLTCLMAGGPDGCGDVLGACQADL